ncbi:MAG: serine hydrolase domain-containing protein [Planctomycetota bacterium]
MSGRTCARLLWLYLLLACESPSTVPSTEAEPAAGSLVGRPRLELLDELERWTAASDPIGCELLVLEDGELLFWEAAGWSDPEREIPWRRGRICRIRSLTKPFVATLALQLVAEGRLDLDASILGGLFDDLDPAAEQITVRQLLTQTAGFDQPGYPGELTAYRSLREVAEAIVQRGPTFVPGTVFLYSDANTMLLGAVIESLTERPLAEVLEERILRPLGLKETLLDWSEDDPRAAKMVPTYRMTQTGTEAYWTPGQPQLVPWFRASGGLYSSAEDLATFLTAWADPSDARLGVPPDSRVVARSPSAPSRFSPASAYGMHWQIFETMQPPGFGHTGSDGTIAWVDPAHDRIVIYLSQTRGTQSIARVPNLVTRVLEGR